jgi:hypothetical protein
MHLKTLQGEGIPAKGTTVWYLQHKTVHANNSISNNNVLTRPVRIIEALEGILVGVHKEVRINVLTHIYMLYFSIHINDFL